MDHGNRPVIDREEVFRLLPRSPIVEAVLHIQSRPTKPFDPSELRARLDSELNGYVFSNELLECTSEITFGKDASHNAGSKTEWKGFHYKAEDSKHAILLFKDGIAYSMLKPYTSWNDFVTNGLNVWTVFKRIAQPDLIMRVGLRIINRFSIPHGTTRLEDYLETAPKAPKGFDIPYLGFLHQETLAVPDSPYMVNLVKTIQPPLKGESGPAVFIDIDTFVTPNEMVGDETLKHYLADMRHIKNKVFFGTVTDKAVEAFK